MISAQTCNAFLTRPVEPSLVVASITSRVRIAEMRVDSHKEGPVSGRCPRYQALRSHHKEKKSCVKYMCIFLTRQSLYYYVDFFKYILWSFIMTRLTYLVTLLVSCSLILQSECLEYTVHEHDTILTINNMSVILYRLTYNYL